MELDLNQFYENYNEEGRLLTRAGHVEFATTIDIFRKD